MKVDIYSLDGKKIKSVELPKQFDEPIRDDLIKRAVLAIRSAKRTRYGAKKEAGKRASATISKRRRDYKTSYGKGIARGPRKIMTKRGTQFYWVGAFAPNTVGGRRAHPPKPEKVWEQRINKKERKKAIRSAMNATTNLEIVKKRGHNIDYLPLIIESKFENIEKTNEVKKTLIALGLKKELERTQKKSVRAGRGKSRGRKYKMKKGPLIVISKECPLRMAARNVLGVELCLARYLNTELLAPGAVPGRLTIYTEDSIRVIDEKKLFLDNPYVENMK